MDDNTNYKEILVGEGQYYFFSDDLEIVRSLDSTFDAKKRTDSKRSVSLRLVGNNTKRQLEISKKTRIGVNLVSGCNLSCRYCYLTAANRPLLLLAEDRFREIVRFLKQNDCEEMLMYFVGGGEPTLNIGLMQKIPQICREEGLENISFELTTNGTNMSDELLSFLINYNVKLYISLDGNEEANSARVFKNGKPAFAIVQKNMELLKRNNVPFSCKAIVQPGKGKMLECVSYFEEKQIPFGYDFAVESFDGSFKPSIMDLDTFDSELSDVMKLYENRIASGKKVYSGNIITGLLRLKNRSKIIVPCSAVIDGYIIDIDGKIYSCAMNSSSPEMSIGDIKRGINYEKVLKKEYYPKAVDTNMVCHCCWARYLCGGGCFATNVVTNGDATRPNEFFCEVQKLHWEHLIKLYVSLWGKTDFQNFR